MKNRYKTKDGLDIDLMMSDYDINLITKKSICDMIGIDEGKFLDHYNDYVDRTVQKHRYAKKIQK